MPFFNPRTVQVVVVVVHEAPPGDAVTLYVTPSVVVIAGHDKVIDLLAIDVAIDVGASGAPSGVAVAVTAEAAPSELVPTTDTEYNTPFVKPEIVHVVEVVEHDAPPGVAVAT